MTVYDAEPDARDIAYWTKHAVPRIAALLKTAGYSSSDQATQLATLMQHVVPQFGPRPSKANSPSFLMGKASPFEAQINVSAGDPLVRYSWEPVGLHGGSERDPWNVNTSRHAIKALSEKMGFSTKWLDAVFDAYAPGPELYEAMATALPGWMMRQFGVPEPPPLKRIPFSLMGCDLKGSKAAVKCYLSPQLMELASGESSTKIALKALRGLEPALNPGTLDMIEEFLVDRPKIFSTGFDCVDEADLSNARVKIYLATPSNSFNTVREYITLGGRITNAATEKYLSLLRGVWHLMLQDLEDRDDDDYETPIMGNVQLYFSIEIRPGERVPEVKVYVPTRRYAKGDKHSVQCQERVFAKIGHPWGEPGVYRAIYEDAFGSVDMELPESVHSDVSFFYTEDSGIYQTIYYAAGLDPE